MKRGRPSSPPPSGIEAKRPFRGTERFQLLKRLGEGGYGAVYEAYDRVRDQRVALKVLTRIGPEHVMRFKQEFRALQDLQHPNLVQLGEMFEDEGRWFFTMELVQGADWLEYVRGGVAPQLPDNDGKATGVPFDEARLRPSLEQLVEGVVALHRGGKVHRDIKPSNIQVTDDGRVVLLDFGLVTNVEGRQTTEALAVGTAAYMAPEQATGVPVGAAADWYGVGVVLYEALTGRLPFTGSAFEMLLSKQSSEPTPPRVLIPDIPVDLSALCVGLLKPEPGARLSGDEVVRQVRGGRPPDTDHSLARQSGTALTRGVPFVGRESERSALKAMFQRMRDERRMAAVYVHGESGVGKTALVHEFTDEIEGDRSRVVVLRGRCYERETVPYKAFDGVVDALTRFMRTLSDTDCTALLPRRAHALPMVFPVLGRIKAITWHAGPRFTDVDRATLRTHALSALRELFQKLSEKYDLVVVIDDLQWADAESLALLLDLSHGAEALPIMLIVTARDPEECPSDVRHALDLLAEQAPMAQRIRLEGLPLADAQRLAEALLEAGEHAVSVDAVQVAREAEGHPLFIDALVRYSQQVRLTEGARPELDDALRFRIGQLDPDARRLLELCALAAAPLPHKVVADAAGWPLARATTSIAKLRVLKLVRTSRTRQSETVETFHDRMRHATVTRLTPSERRKLHGKLAEAIEATDLIDVEAAAFHYREAHAFDKAALFAERAADRAMENLAFDKAARLYREVVELDPEKRWETSVKLADALSNAGRGREAADVYLATVDRAPPERRNELLRRAVRDLLGSGNVDAGLKVATDLFATIDVTLPETLRGVQLSLLYHRARLALRGLSFRARDNTEVPEDQLSRVDTLWAMAALGMVDHFRGAELQTRHLLWALAAGERYRLSRALSLESWLRAAGGKRHDAGAARAVSLATELAQASGHPHALALAQLSAGILAHARGQLAEARRECEAAEAMLRERCTGVTWELTNARMFGLLATLAMADGASLRRRVNGALRESLERGDRYAYTNLTTTVGYLVTVLDGDIEDAEASVDEAMSAWSQQGFSLQHALALVARGSIALARGDVEQAARIVDGSWPTLEASRLLQAEGVALPARWLRARIAAALVAREPARRATVTSELHRLSRMGHGGAPLAARCVEAVLMAGDGDRAGAAATLAEAQRELAAREMHLVALAAGWARGSLVSGLEGQRITLEAEGEARARGLGGLATMARIFVPLP